MSPPDSRLQSFDFLIGRWKIANRRLATRLQQCDEWIEFPAEMETRPILDGLGVMDELRTSFFGDELVGLSVRLFDPTSGTWTIYWADTFSPERGLTEQVTGRFDHGIGVFHGTETFEGREVRLRFTWSGNGTDAARWEQAYYDEAREAWETNWVMDFSRVEAGPRPEA